MGLPHLTIKGDTGFGSPRILGESRTTRKLCAGPNSQPRGPEVAFGEVWSILASQWEGAAKGMITSIIVHYLR